MVRMSFVAARAASVSMTTSCITESCQKVHGHRIYTTCLHELSVWLPVIAGAMGMSVLKRGTIGRRQRCRSVLQQNILPAPSVRQWAGTTLAHPGPAICGKSADAHLIVLQLEAQEVILAPLRRSHKTS
jgi:hypothetical protein